MPSDRPKRLGDQRIGIHGTVFEVVNMNGRLQELPIKIGSQYLYPAYYYSKEYIENRCPCGKVRDENHTCRYTGF